MKRNRFWAVSVITAAVVVGLLVGCGGGGGGSSQDFIVGTWELYAISLSLDSYRDPDLGPIASTLRCFSNHEAEWTMVYPGGGGTVTGIWTNLGTFYTFDDGSPQIASFFPSGPDLYLVFPYSPGLWYWMWYQKV